MDRRHCGLRRAARSKPGSKCGACWKMEIGISRIASLRRRRLEAARVLADEAREMRAAEARRVSGGDLSPKMGVRSCG